MIDDPLAPLLGVTLVMLGAGTTVNDTPPLAIPPGAVTITFPVPAPDGTVAVMAVLLHELTAAVSPLMVTTPLPWVEPKLVPAITIDDPTAPLFGLRLVMPGAGVTVNGTPGLATPPAAVTTTFPVVAPAGNSAVMLALLQELTVAAVP